MASIHEAAATGNLVQLRAILATGVDVDAQRDGNDMTALRYAAYFGHTACLKALLAAGASVHSTYNFGATALHEAAARGRAACVRVLIVAGSDVNHVLVDLTDWTPFARALSSGHPCVLKILLRAGANVRTANIGRYD